MFNTDIMGVFEGQGLHSSGYCPIINRRIREYAYSGTESVVVAISGSLRTQNEEKWGRLMVFIEKS